MSRRRIGRESFGFESGGARRHSTLDDLSGLIDWTPVEGVLATISNAPKGEPAWPPLALFKAMLLPVWRDLSDVKLAEALDDRASFRRFCGFSLMRRRPNGRPSSGSARHCRRGAGQDFAEPADPSGAGTDREDLRHVEAQLRSAPDAMGAGSPKPLSRSALSPQILVNGNAPETARRLVRFLPRQAWPDRIRHVLAPTSRLRRSDSAAAFRCARV